MARISSYERTGILLGVIILVTVILVRVAAATGAPIPTQMGGYFYPPAARNDCLETYRADKSFRCDRVYNWSN